MQVIRILDKNHYDPQRGNFQSLAFENWGEGISVIRLDCIKESDLSICQHIQHWYPDPPAGERPFFWRLDTSELPDGASLVNSLSDDGDECHSEIRGLSDNRAKKFFRKYQKASAPDLPETFYACDEGGESYRNLTRSICEAEVGCGNE